MLYLIALLLLMSICGFMTLWDNTDLSYIWGILGCGFLLGAIIISSELIIFSEFNIFELFQYGGKG